MWCAEGRGAGGGGGSGAGCSRGPRERTRKDSGRTSALYSGNDHVSPASGPRGASDEEDCHSALETAMCWRQGFKPGSREAWLEPELASLQAVGPWVCHRALGSHAQNGGDVPCLLGYREAIRCSFVSGIVEGLEMSANQSLSCSVLSPGVSKVFQEVSR